MFASVVNPRVSPGVPARDHNLRNYNFDETLTLLSLYISFTKFNLSHRWRLNLSPRILETIDSVILPMSARTKASRQAAPPDHFHLGMYVWKNGMASDIFGFFVTFVPSLTPAIYHRPHERKPLEVSVFFYQMKPLLSGAERLLQPTNLLRAGILNMCKKLKYRISIVLHRGRQTQRFFVLIDWNLNGLIFNRRILLRTSGAIKTDSRVGQCGST